MNGLRSHPFGLCGRYRFECAAGHSLGPLVSDSRRATPKTAMAARLAAWGGVDEVLVQGPDRSKAI
jgi:hypothetical protein